MKKVNTNNSRKDFSMSARERSRAEFLIVEPEPDSREQMRTALRANGYVNMYQASDHLNALDILMTRNFTHTIFSARSTNIPVTEYVSKALNTSPNMIAIAASFQPDADDVFELLQLGARGFIVKPYTAESLDSGVLLATKGDPLSEAILQATDRNEAFSALIAASLDKLADAARNASQYNTAAKDAVKHHAALKATTELARMFAKDGEEALLERMVDFLIERGSEPASRLGRLRGKLRKRRQGLQTEDNTKTTVTSD